MTDSENTSSPANRSSNASAAARADLPGRRLRDALEPIAAVSFHSDPAIAAYAGLGLDFATAYPWLRSCVLGEVNASVVVAAFGVFEPASLARRLETARRAVALDAIRAATLAGASAALADVLMDVDVDEVRDVTAVLRRGVEAADDTARALFAGVRGQPWPEDPYAALWHGATAWREYRGDSHLAACVAADVSGIESNLLTELQVGYGAKEYAATRGWSDDQLEAASDALRRRGLLDSSGLTEQGRTFRDDVERATDSGVSRGVDALGADVERVVERANAWSQLIIERGWFPADEKKRAAG